MRQKLAQSVVNIKKSYKKKKKIFFTKIKIQIYTHVFCMLI